jgi:hypothetical protein
VLDDLLTYNELRLKADELRCILRFEHTSRGIAKTAFMEAEQEATEAPFTEFELKLLCQKVKFVMLFPQCQPTQQLISKCQENERAIRNYIRLRDDGGQLSTASRADFLQTVYASDAVDADYHPHFMIQ